MKQTIARLYVITISLLIVIGGLYLGNEVRLSINDYKFESRNTSKEVSTLIENNWFKNKSFSTQSLNNELESYMKMNTNLRSIIIYSKDEGLKVVSSRNSDRSFLLNSFTPDDPNWNGGPEYSFSWWADIENIKITSPLAINKSGYSVDIIYNILFKEKIQDNLLEAIIVLAILFILTIIVIILFSAWKNKYTVKEYDDELFKPMDESPVQSQKDSISTDIDELDEIEDLGIENSLDDTSGEDDLGEFDLDDDSLGDFDLDDDSGLEDFDLDSHDDLDDFEIGTTDAKVDELDDFDLDIDEPSETAEEMDELDDFDLDIEEPTESIEEIDELDDFDLDIEEPTEPIEEIDELDDFDLDIEEPTEEVSDELDELGDFNLDIEETEEVSDELDELDDFDLDIEETEEVSDELDELDDFNLDIEETEEVSDELDELDDFDLDIEETEEVSDELDELDDFNLDIEETEEVSDELNELGDLDLDIEETEEVSDELDELGDLDLDIEETEEVSDELDELDDFNLDIEETEEVSDELDELDDLDLDIEETEEVSDELDDLADISDMDLSPETIEASTDLNELPEMDIEEDILKPKSDFKTKEESGPEISSLLEKAGVAETDLSIAVFSLNGLDLSEHYSFIKNHFSNNDNIFELDNNQIAVALDDMDNNAAINEINQVIESAKDEGLDITAGISSMNGRRVGENRLMGEAISALSKAKEDSKEMLAFRPDPSKYKEFIKNS